VEIVGLHDHVLDAELGELLLHGRILQPLHRLLVNASDDVARGLLRHHHPDQKSKSDSGKPASSVVGTSGRADARFEPPTARARTLPSRMKGIATVSGQK